MEHSRIEYVYYDLDNNPITQEQYELFLQKYYGTNASVRLQRVSWYKSMGAYKLLLAIKDGEPVGQISAYRIRASIAGRPTTIWWGVDNFVLDDERGQGIGKKLQMKLHQDLENFSSVSYSRLNGIIKRKCGAKELMQIPFTYLPVNSFFSLLLRIILHRKFHKEIRVPTVFRNKYYHLNSLLNFGHKHYTVYELRLETCFETLTPLIAESLKKYDFYVIRDKGYLQWKYLNNPTIGHVHILGFYSTMSKKLLGCIIFSEPFEKDVFSVPSTTIVTILDCFIFDNNISTRQMVLECIREYCKKRVLIDGILYIGKIPYYPILRYPYKGRYFLSTIVSDGPIQNPYLGYSDQDMEQVGI